MLSRTRTAFKFLTWGILVGIFFAPQSGAQTRHQVKSWTGSTVRDFVGGMTGSGADR